MSSSSTPLKWHPSHALKQRERRGGRKRGKLKICEKKKKNYKERTKEEEEKKNLQRINGVIKSKSWHVFCTNLFIYFCFLVLCFILILFGFWEYEGYVSNFMNILFI